MVVQLPAPATLLEITWFLMGFIFGRAFGKKLDQDIQDSDFFKSLEPEWQNITKRFLDFLHHFWIGLLLMLYAPQSEIYWFGYGLFIDDLPDIPARFKKWFNYILNNNS